MEVERFHYRIKKKHKTDPQTNNKNLLQTLSTNYTNVIENINYELFLVEEKNES